MKSVILALTLLCFWVEEALSENDFMHDVNCSRETMDITYEIFRDFSKWGEIPTQAVMQKQLDKYSDCPKEDVEKSLSHAIKLQKAVNESMKHYHDKMPEFRSKIDNLLNKELSGVSSKARSLAERRIMFMYIK